MWKFAKEWINLRIEILFIRCARWVLTGRNVNRAWAVSRRDNNEMWAMGESLELIEQRMRSKYK